MQSMKRLSRPASLPTAAIWAIAPELVSSVLCSDS
jgi:hypothetical protein